MNVRYMLALALLLNVPGATAQTQPAAPSGSEYRGEHGQHPSTIVVCASNTVERRGCDITATGRSDQAPINSAISGCSAANGCRIVLRNGVYNISAAIVIDRSFVTLEGESWPFWGAYLRSWSGTSKPASAVGTQGALVAASATGFNLIEIQHHNLPDNGERRHRGIRIANLYVVGKDYSNNCVDSLSSGNMLDDSGNFENLTLTRCAYGLYISVDNGYINKNNLQDLAAGGAFIAGANSRFTNNIVWDVGGRGLLTTVNGLVVAANTFGDTALYSIDAQGPGVAVITGNQFGPMGASPSASSIHLACSGCVVTGNYFDANTGAFRTQRRSAPVIEVANAAASHNVIVGNSFVPGGTEAVGVFAVDVSASGGNVVLGNSISTGFNNGSAATVRSGTGNLVALNTGDSATVAGGMQAISFQPGPLTSVTNTKGGFSRLARRAIVENIEVSALSLGCSVSPTVTLYECGTSVDCAGAKTIGSATLTSAGRAADGVLSEAEIGAGHYVAWAISAGTCSELNIAATAQVRGE